MLLKRSVLLFAAAAVVTVPVLAQSQGNLRSIVRYRVTSGRGPDFQAAIKEYNAVLKKGGSEKPVTVWQAITGPREYATVRYASKWADLDVATAAQDPKLKEVAPDLQRIGIRIVQCTDSSERIIDEVLPELSLPRTEEMPKLARVLRTRVLPARISDYTALLQSEVLPAIRKSGIKVYAVAQSRYGAPNGEFRTVTGFGSWADLDGDAPIIRGMGRDAYNRFLEKLRPMLVESEYTMYRFMPDLSYQPSRPSGSN